MQIRFLCSVLLLILSCAALAQSPYPILQTQKPEPGVYLTFKEFQNNSPSIKSDFALKPVSMARTLWAGIVDHELVFTGANTKLQARDCWGVSIGDSVYVNSEIFIAARGFRKFEGLGRYCYIQAYADLREPNQPSLPHRLIGSDGMLLLYSISTMEISLSLISF